MFFLYFGSENFSCLHVCSFKCCHQLSITLTVEMACQNNIIRVDAWRRKPTNLKQHPLTVCKPRRNRRKTVTHMRQLLLQHSRQFGTRQKHFMIGLESMILTIILKKLSTVLILRLQRGQCHDGTPSSALSWSIATKVIYFILADTNDVVMFFFLSVELPSGTPHLKAIDINTEISAMWKSMSLEEQIAAAEDAVVALKELRGKGQCTSPCSYTCLL